MVENLNFIASVCKKKLENLLFSKTLWMDSLLPNVRFECQQCKYYFMVMQIHLLNLVIFP